MTVTNEDLHRLIDANESRSEDYRKEMRDWLIKIERKISDIAIQTTETNGKTKFHASWIERYQTAIDILINKNSFVDGSNATIKKIFTGACVVITTCAAIGSFIWWVVKRILNLH